MINDLKYGTFENVVLSPRKSRLPIYDGGLVNPIAYPHYCRHHREGKAINTKIETGGASLKRIKTAPESLYVFGGVYQWHFGHTIAEFVHRLWILEREEFKNATVLFIAPKGHTYAMDFFKETMAYLQVKKWRIIDEPCIVDKLIIAEQGKTLGVASHKKYTDYLVRLAEINRLQESKSGKWPDKVAIMRGHIKGRRFLAEQHLTNYLEAQGYYIFKSDKYPIREQLATIANAKKIIISDGSACHLFDLLPTIEAKVCFLARPLKIKLSNHSLKPKVRAVYNYADTSHLLIPLNNEGKRRKTKALLYADLDKIISFMKRCGFLETGAPSIIKPDYAADIDNYLAGLDRSLTIHTDINLIASELTATDRLSALTKKKLGIESRTIFITAHKVRSGFANLTNWLLER
jgi:capsular polysaccharide biosynthesis protein